MYVRPLNLWVNRHTRGGPPPLNRRGRVEGIIKRRESFYGTVLRLDAAEARRKDCCQAAQCSAARFSGGRQHGARRSFGRWAVGARMPIGRFDMRFSWYPIGA